MKPDLFKCHISHKPYIETLKNSQGLKDEVWEEYYTPILNRNRITVTVNGLRPKSRGTVRLASTNHLDNPLIDPKYFSDLGDQDVNVIIEGIKTAISLTQTDSFKKLGAILYSKPLPGCDFHTFGSDDYWKCYVKSYIYNLGHTVGTAKMGNVNDPTTVLDPRLKVKGIGNLRVVDASAIPFAVAGNSNAPTVSFYIAYIFIYLYLFTPHL